VQQTPVPREEAAAGAKPWCSQFPARTQVRQRGLGGLVAIAVVDRNSARFLSVKFLHR
jgi:hypothetical protein